MRGRGRRMVRVLAVTLVMGGAALVAPAPGAAAQERERPIVRKSAADMSRAEISRFRRAFAYAVREGYLDDFSAQHFNYTRNRMHGSDVLAGAPPAVALGQAPSWGQRLLPWHRAFILEAEAMLRAALRERNRKEGRSTREAARLFIPYWDAADLQDLPRWVRAFQPRGGRATVPPDIPRGHAAFGKPVGSSYDVEFARWPGGNLVFDRLPQPDQVSRIVGQPDFASFLNALDVVSEVNPAAGPAARQGIAVLAAKVPGNPDVQRLIAATDPAYPKDVASQLAAFNSLLAVGYLATSEATKDAPDQELIAAIKAIYAVFTFPPHVVLHLWAGGLDPENAAVRGTVTYFNELTVDPVFWMLHAELDRYWYSWEQTHAGEPPLQGADAVFQPLTRREGRWYGGGRRYELAALTGPSDLAYRYDRVLAAPPAAPVRASTFSAPAGFACVLPVSG